MSRINKTTFLTFITIIFCFITGHIQNDLIPPSFPDMRRYFSSSVAVFHLISSSFSIGMSIGGVVFGPFSDFYGRKKTLLFGLGLLTLGCSGGILSGNIYLMIVTRFFQGFGAAAPVIICVAMVFDLYDKNKSRQFIGTKNGIITASKALTPIIGGYINFYFSWQINFFLLALLALSSLVLVSFWLPISKLSQSENSINYKKLLALLINKKMCIYTLILGSIASCLITFTIAAPIIYIDHLSVHPKRYGFHQGAIWLAFGIFSFLNHYLIGIFSLAKTKYLGFLMLILGNIMLNIATYVFTTPISVTASMLTLSIGSAILINIFFADAMTLNPYFKGSSSSIIAFFRTFLVAITSALSGFFFNGSMVPLASIIFILTLLTIMLYITVIKKTE